MEWRKGGYAAHTDPSVYCPIATEGFVFATPWNTRTEADTLRAEVARLKAALEPFADVSDFLASETEGVTDDVRFDLTLSDSTFLVMYYTAKQFHDARAALAHGEADQ
tara:strand:+ start:841 stop:1164 length:324 start_codon:yes stop_codon:yes gene_type:complete